jgi:ferredoxin-NADP reductase
VLQPGNRPVLLISAGVGATPVMAMLHALAAAESGRGRSAPEGSARAGSGRDVWWLHGARSRATLFSETGGDARARLGRCPQ